jgi:hypothetical protein
MIDRAELDLFRNSLRQAVERYSGLELDAALAAAGWADALEADPPAAAAVLFPLLGSANATCRALEQVFTAAAGIKPPASSIVVMPPLGNWSPPASEIDGRLSVRGVGRPGPGGSQALVVTAGGQARLVDAGDIRIRQIHGIDPSFGLAEIEGENLAFEPAGPARWDDGVTLAQIALGHELAGSARKMLDLARDHALERIQFGRPIASFQAVRHRLAETLVSIESAEAMLDAAGGEPHAELASMAKALAGRAAKTAGRHCQQVLAGIGFTAEHPFHRYFRRTLLLDQLLGSTRTLTEDLGRSVLSARRLAQLLPL